MSIAQIGPRPLAEPVYAIGEYGMARRLPVGLPVEVVRWGGVKPCPGAVTILTDEPSGSRLGSHIVWYVTASALRFEEVGS